MRGTITRECLLSVALCGFAATTFADMLPVPPLLRMQPAATTLSREVGRDLGHNACAHSGAALCYDYRTGRAVFKPARALLPKINGLRGESITLKRQGLYANYSFK